MKKIIFLFSIIALSFLTNIDFAGAQTQEQVNDRVDLEKRKSMQDPDRAIVIVLSNTQWTASVEDSHGEIVSREGNRVESFVFDCARGGSFAIEVVMRSPKGQLDAGVIQNGVMLIQADTTEKFGAVSLTEQCYHPAGTNPSSSGGGCLIATATYDSELAPQVQLLRELRDNKLLRTESGFAFMESFNDFYYSFSPVIADYERENPYFKQGVKLAITPMISSLAILNHVEMETDVEVLVYGISLILLNVGMYLGVPAIVVIGIRKKF